MSALILIIEDEVDLSTSLDYRLSSEGFQTRTAFTGEDGLALARQEPVPDLVLLDLMLPDIQGTEICRRLRSDPKTKDISIIMLTARGEEVDRIVGFELGVDDFLAKPCSMRELVLRIKAVLRRGSRVDQDQAEKIVFGCLSVDIAGHQVWVHDQDIPLTALEFKLLVTLLGRKGRVQSRDTLLDDVWGYSVSVTTRTVDTHVKRLREKLGAAGGYIETLRGVGYRFSAKPDGS